MVPDHKLLFIACESGDEAYFLGGDFQFDSCQSALYSASVGVQTQRYYPTESRTQFPEFDPKNRLTDNCGDIESMPQREAKGTESRNPDELEPEMPSLRCTGSQRRELKDIIDYYGEILRLRGRAPTEDEETE